MRRAFRLAEIHPLRKSVLNKSAFLLDSHLGQNDVRTIEDLAGCATDDLVGWTEKDQKHAGILSDFDLSREQAEAVIMAARLMAGWIEAKPETEPAPQAGDETEAAN